MQRLPIVALVALAACTAENPDHIPDQLRRYFDTDLGRLVLPGEAPDMSITFPPDPDLGPLPPDLMPPGPDLFLCIDNKDRSGSWCCLPAFSSGCSHDSDCCDFYKPDAGFPAKVCFPNGTHNGVEYRCCSTDGRGGYNCAP